MPESFNAQAFLISLNDGGLKTPLICTGLAKPVEGKGSEDGFLFSAGASCEDWIPVSLKVVEKVEHLGKRSCRDHSHPEVRVHFKEPPAGEPFGAVFAALLRASFAASRAALIQDTIGDLDTLDFGGDGPVSAPWLLDFYNFVREGDERFNGGRGGGRGDRGGGQTIVDVLERIRCNRWARECRQGNKGSCLKFETMC